MRRLGIIAGAGLGLALVGAGFFVSSRADASTPLTGALQRELPEALSLPELDDPELPLRPPRPTVFSAPRQLSASEALAQHLAELGARSRVEPGAPSVAPALLDGDGEGLARGLTALVSSYDRDAEVSVHVREVPSQTVLFDYHGEESLIPASNAKLITSAAALDLLGPDYTFATKVGLKDQTLYVRGEGDPSLDLDDLTAIANLVASKVDLAQVERLVVDDTAFSPERLGPGYDPDGPGWSYEAPSGALSLEFNTVGVSVFPVEGSRYLGATVSTPGDNVVIENHGWIGSRDRLSVSTHPDGDKTVVEIRGTLKRKTLSASFRRRIFDPGMYTGAALAELLAERSSSEPLPVERGVMPADADIVLRNESEPLLDVLDVGLAYSNNFVAEQVLRTTAWRMTGTPGSWDAGQTILHDYFDAVVGDADGFVFDNGSGLSRTGRATTEGLVDLLTMATRSRDDGLLDALPIAGEEGTLRNRLRRSDRRVHAKTGTLDGVSALSGVITSEDGEPQVAFSILINATNPRLNASRRRSLEDAIVTRVLSALDEHSTDAALNGTAPG